MSMLKPAKNRMAYAKVGLYGTAGSGNTVTAAKIAVAILVAAIFIAAVISGIS